jgi:hypothetical protein
VFTAWYERLSMFQLHLSLKTVKYVILVGKCMNLMKNIERNLSEM